MTTNRVPESLRPSRWPLRLRSALAAGLVVGLTLLVGAGALLLMLDRSLVGAVDSAATARATDIANQLTHDSPAELDPALFTTDSRISVVQIISPAGQVVRSSSPTWPTPLIKARPAPGEPPVSGVPATSGPESDLRVTAHAAVSPTGPVTVLVAASKESVESTLITVAVLLAVGGPLIVLVAAAATWALVGRSLGSVEAIRSQVAAIGAAQLSERVPVPPTKDEIARLATTMNAMLARVEAGHLAQRRFVGDASHELRSPLATLTTALEVARARPEAFDRELLTETLLPETERMRDLVEDLLVLARADETGIALRLGDVDLDDIADTEARRQRLRGELTVRAATAPARITGDLERLARVVRNLVDNAAAHTTSQVMLTTEMDGDTARVIVDDDGPGIPQADRERVFERFVRLQDDRSRATGGSGLGLAIVAEIVAAHGGSVTIDDAPLGGARFVVELPADGPVSAR